ncbi:ArnT family glycosyltransferase [Lewinella sp. IMCC34183]|uniref:ArnT family glycosyltransferase n=1 Tax=Lewinella sp. IMCC34183 TaxID=2248762 RepID=UPI000E224C00|nr:glycosyltransferase family 39 protein [Lewinella sp. IMCC34183]
MPKRALLTLIAFLALATAMRWGSFFVSVIDHDESTYIVIADELLRGETYLRDVIDTKPIGIFWIYALLIQLTGGSIFALRLAAALVVGLGGWVACVVNRRATGSDMAGYVAGVVYVLMTSVFTYYGISPNTEIFFNLFTLGALAISVAAPRKHWGWAGILLGLGFLIKPFVAAEALAIGLYLLWYYRQAPVRMVANGLLLTLAFLLPLAGLVAYYRHLGLPDALYFYGVEVALAYPVELSWPLRLKYMGDYLLRYAPLILLGGWAQVRGRSDSKERTWVRYLLLQAVLVSIMILLTGKRFGHYQIQLHPVVALWVGSAVATVWTDALRRRWVAYAVAAVAVAIGLAHAAYYAKKDDAPRRTAAWLTQRLDPGETFVGVNGFQIVYHLTDRPVPTPYVHSSLLFEPTHHRAFRIDQAREAAYILADPTVRYLVARAGDPALDSRVARTLLEAFEPVGQIDAETTAYRRLSPGSRPPARTILPSGR